MIPPCVFQIPVSMHKFETREEIEEKLSDLISNRSNVTEIILSGNSYSVEACKVICEIVGECKHLQVANFSDMFVGRFKDIVLEGVTHLCAGLVKCEELVEVNFSDNALGSDCVPGLQVLLENRDSLKRAIFNNNGLDQEAGKLLSQYLSASNRVKLQAFSAMRNRLQVGGFKAIAEALGNMGSLQRIEMPYNTINAEGTLAFLQCMQSNPDLKVIKLFDNNINTVAALQALRDGVTSAKKLQTLDIGECLLKNDGAEILFEALKGNCAELKELHISGNDMEVDEDLAESIIAGLKNKPDLQLVNLKDNEVEEEVQEQLRKGIPDTKWQFESDEEEEEEEIEVTIVEEDDSEQDDVMIGEPYTFKIGVTEKQFETRQEVEEACSDLIQQKSRTTQIILSQN